MSARCWAVVPAAGVGRRMGTDLPKQYLEVAGKAVIEHTLDALLGFPRLRGVVVAVAPGDRRWAAIERRRSDRVHAVEGGRERCHSVLNALEALASRAAVADWVLVHDAARPCVSRGELERLVDGVEARAAEARAHRCAGGLLGLPVGDTLKRVDPDGRVVETVPRDGLWRALTPQMFRLGELREALAGCLERGEAPTDECQAMERFPGAGDPWMVEGAATNIKITHRADLELVAQYFAAAVR